MTSSGKLEKQYVSDLRSLFEVQGPQLYDGNHSLCLTNVCLYHLLKALTILQDETPSNQFTELRHLCDCLSKVKSFKLITDRKAAIAPSLLNLDITLFKSLQSLTLKRIPIKSLSGLQRVREQLRSLVIERCGVSDIEDVIVKCGHDEARPFVWNCLKELDMSANTIIAVGEALQYLPSLERVNFSNNQIGSTDNTDIAASDLSDTNYCLSLTSGIKYIDSVKWLHLGYNRLICVPKFGDRAMYNLCVLILRNNSLRNIEGIEILDALTELDIGENLISQYSNLAPLQNLHNLTQLTLVGNPVTFDPSYRLKTVQHLSYVVSSNMFQLDGKKLSSAERKMVPRSITHYSSSKRGTTPTSLSSSSLSLSNGTAPLLSSSSSPQRNENSVGENNNEHLVPSEKKSHEQRKSSVQKAPRLITFDEDEEQQLTSSTPLKYGDKIRKDQSLRNQLRASWLSSANVAANQSKDKRADDSRPLPRRSSPPTITVQSHDSVSTDIATLRHSELKTESNTTGYSIVKTHSETTTTLDTKNNTTIIDMSSRYSPESSHAVGNRSPISQQTNNYFTNPFDNIDTPVMMSDDIVAVNQTKKKKSPKKQNKKKATLELQKVVEVCDVPFTVKGDKEEEIVKGEGESDVFDMEESDGKYLEQSSSMKVSAILTAEMFQVTLYDSGSEDDGATMEDPQVLMTLSDRFIQEVTLNGDVQDQLDLQCLSSAKIKTRRFKNAMRPILVLHFNYERRDRRKREYLLADVKDECKIMRMLEPIIEQNTADDFVATKLECLKCQVVIDWSEALEDPLVPSPLSRHSLDHKACSIQNKICPYCKEKFLILQASSEQSGSQKRSFPRNDSPKVIPIQETKPSIGFNMETDFHSSVDPDVHSQNCLSPGHMNVSLFATYPDASRDDDERSTSSGIGPFNIVSEPLLNDDSTATEIIVSDERPPSSGMGPFNIVSEPSLNDDSTATEIIVSDTNKTVCEEDVIGVFQHHHGNKDDHETVMIQDHTTLVGSSLQPLKNSSDEGYSSHKRTSRGSEKQFDSDPFSDDNPFHSGSEHEEQNPSPYERNLSSHEQISSPYERNPSPHERIISSPYERNSSPRERNHSCNRHRLFAGSPTLSLSHFKPGVNSVEQNTFIKQQDRTHRKPPRYSSPVNTDSPPLGLTNSPISVSVPSDNASFMSYFRRSSKEKKNTHSRTKSQDLQQQKVHVPPLPDNLVNRSTDKVKSSQESLKSKTNSQSSLTSDNKSGLRYNDRNSSGEERRTSSGNGSGRFRFSVKKRRFSKNTDKVGKSSSETEEGRHVNSDLVLYRNNDPLYLHNNLVLHLSMNVFDSDKEKFQLALRAPMIEYGDWNEIETFLIISNQMAYLYRVTGPESLDPETWLELGRVLKLNEVVYIEIGVCYQSLRLEFDNPPRCYTFMIGIEESCRKIFDLLSYIVSDAPGSLFASIRVTQFSLTDLTDPHKVLEEQIMEYYDNHNAHSMKSSIKPKSSLIQEDRKDEELEVFVLAHKYSHGSDLAKVLVTLVLTNRHLYIGLGNPQWPFPALHLLPDKEDLLPPYSGVIRKDVDDVEKLLLYDDNPLQLTLKFFNEGLYDDNRQSSWTIILKCNKSMKKFISCLNNSWRKQFQQDLPVVSV